MKNSQHKDLMLDEVSYEIHLFPAEQGLKICSKLIKIIGEPLVELGKMQGDKEKMYDHLASAVRSLSSRLVDEEVVAICKQLCSCVVLEGDGSMTLDKKFNLHFRGRLGHLFKLLVEVVNYNFADFLDVLALQQTEPAQKDQK